MVTNLAYKYRIYPNQAQQVSLKEAFDASRFIWNMCVESFQQSENPIPSTGIRKAHEWLQNVSAALLQQKQRDFEYYKNQFFNKTRGKQLGKPKFKSKKHSKQTFRLPNGKFTIQNNKIRLEKIGWVTFVEDRPIPEGAKLLSVTVSRNNIGEYYASVCFEYQNDPVIQDEKVVGIDAGFKSFATCSDGTVVKNPRFFIESQEKLTRMQRHLSKKKYESKRYEKQKQKVGRIHNSTANKRKWFTHNFTTWVVRNFDVICIEDLNLVGMSKIFGKSVHDAAWGEVRHQLEYKTLKAGKCIVLADRFFPSSKTCSNCGTIQDMPLRERTYNCLKCGMELDRDMNAAMNLYAIGAQWRNARRVQSNVEASSSF